MSTPEAWAEKFPRRTHSASCGDDYAHPWIRTNNDEFKEAFLVSEMSSSDNFLCQVGGAK